MKITSIVPIERIENRIYVIRGQRVMLDQDLASLYEVETRTLNQAVKRNLERFPDDFMFRLNEKDVESLRSQIVILEKGYGRSQIETESLRYQIGTLEKSGRGKYSKYLPYAFTEQGVAMLSGLLNSPRAVTVNVEIMRAFVRMRHGLLTQEKIGKTVEELKSFMLKHSNQTDREFRKVLNAIETLAEPAPENAEPMGFKLNTSNPKKPV
jgi:phage regulator Rha-like protein